MSIQASDIHQRLSGGASNTQQNLSLGGAKSTTVASAFLFDDVSASEASSGKTEYRCMYIHNAHGSLTLTSALIWISVPTPSPSTSIEIAVGSSAINAQEQTVANEASAPTGVTFSAPSSVGSALALGDIPPGQHRAVWIKRIVTAGAATANDGFTLRTQGDTLP